MFDDLPFGMSQAISLSHFDNALLFSFVDLIFVLVSESIKPCMATQKHICSYNQILCDYDRPGNMFDISIIPKLTGINNLDLFSI